MDDLYLHYILDSQKFLRQTFGMYLGFIIIYGQINYVVYDKILIINISSCIKIKITINRKILEQK